MITYAKSTEIRICSAQQSFDMKVSTPVLDGSTPVNGLRRIITKEAGKAASCKKNRLPSSSGTLCWNCKMSKIGEVRLIIKHLFAQAPDRGDRKLSKAVNIKGSKSLISRKNTFDKNSKRRNINFIFQKIYNSNRKHGKLVSTGVQKKWQQAHLTATVCVDGVQKKSSNIQIIFTMKPTIDKKISTRTLSEEVSWYLRRTMNLINRQYTNIKRTFSQFRAIKIPL